MQPQELEMRSGHSGMKRDQGHSLGTMILSIICVLRGHESAVAKSTNSGPRPPTSKFWLHHVLTVTLDKSVKLSVLQFPIV